MLIIGRDGKPSMGNLTEGPAWEAQIKDFLCSDMRKTGTLPSPEGEFTISVEVTLEDGLKFDKYSEGFEIQGILAR
jgi:hypothetical protein